eukprot:10330541-Alexandrium_andersonii.AAC.1
MQGSPRCCLQQEPCPCRRGLSGRRVRRGALRASSRWAISAFGVVRAGALVAPALARAQAAL